MPVSVMMMTATEAATAFKPTPTMEEDVHEAVSERPPGQFEIWTSIQAQKAASAQQQKDEPYVPPLARRSSGLLSQTSLETCTEALGSETGSDGYSSSDETPAASAADFFSLLPEKGEEKADDDDCSEDEEEEVEGGSKKELVTVNYHCSISRRSSQPRSFPPPLPSISRRDGHCIQMRPHRRDGRLVVEAVPVPSQNYLHAERLNGRLLLSFIDTSSSSSPRRNDVVVAAKTEQQKEAEAAQEEEADEDADEEEEEEEVEVVDRGTVVEVKVSTQHQQIIGGAAAAKVRRSSIVINKFVSCTAATGGSSRQEIAIADQAAAAEAARKSVSPGRRMATATTTAAAAAVAASTLSGMAEADGSHTSTNDNKLLFTSRRRSREELMHDMSRCSLLRKPLFIWEPFCIATSS